MNGADHTRGGGKRASNKVYIDNGELTSTPSTSTPSTAGGGTLPDAVPSSPSKPSSSTRKRVTLKLSHDISTEQLFSDQLIDGKVADGEDDDVDDEDEDNNADKTKDATGHSHRSNHKQRRSSHRKSSGRHSSKSKSAALPPTQDEDGAGDAPKPIYRIESHSHLSSLDAKHLDKHQQFAADATATKPSNRLALAPLSKPPTGDASTPTADGGVCAKCRSATDMPPLHCAAYAGHTNCLTLLLDEATNQSPTTASVDESLRPFYLDKKKRTPLFYSCAANRLDCCALLLTKRSEWRDLADKQLDTPVHVCCFFGWHECLQRLLDTGADPHGRNAKGFKPSHIAKTKECLELLLSYGDDLQQGDKLGRTPLFVACARDRSLCVEFLCHWNHQTKSWMLEQEDQRGDKPIHAAACNGSNASLEILLRYGADPTVVNANGLAPKALAAANNHPKCVELLAAAEQELANANTWFAPANASSGSSTPTVDDASGWIECWDNSSGQPFYYHNLSGKCQWEVPYGFTPHLLQLIAQASEPQQQPQQQQYEDDENGEYVWVKKKRQTVCVATGKESEWTAVQDPVSKAIYYKNTRTGQSQWEEPDAVQQLQSASAALVSQQASKVWDELDASRTALAKALAADRRRQQLAQLAAVEQCKLEIQRRRDDIRKREEQAKLQLLLPRSSFIRRKKQSMMIKIKGTPHAAEDEDRMEQICQREPSLDIFLSTYVRLHGVRDLQLSIEKRFFNCLFHYYVALVDPVQCSGLSKSQFRTVLRDAGVIPSSFATATASTTSHASSYANLSLRTQQPPTLKLHVVDLIFAQAARVEAMDTSAASGLHASGSFSKNAAHSASHASLVHSQQHRQAGGVSSDSHLGVVGFVAAMQIVRERMVALAEEQHDADTQQPVEIDDDEEWFLTTFILPLTVRLGGKMLTLIRECKELDLEITASAKVQAMLAQNRHAVQRLHRYYTAQEPNKQLKMLTFRGLSQFAQEFGLVPQQLQLPALHQLYEAVNWISGHAHTEIISFEKFQQLLAILAMRSSSTGVAAEDREAVLVQTLVAFLSPLETSAAVHRVMAATRSPVDAGGETEAVVEKSFFILSLN